jgi:DNA-binding transcriptional LysR family regulator
VAGGPAPAPAKIQVARRSRLRIEDLRDQPLVMFRPGYDLREATISACKQAGFEPRFAVEGGEMDAVLRFVEAGLGLAVVPSMVLAGRPGLRGMPLVVPKSPPAATARATARATATSGHGAESGLRRTIALAHRKDVALTHAARAFQATLETFVSEAGRDGTLPPGVEAVGTPPTSPMPSPMPPTSPTPPA